VDVPIEVVATGTWVYGGAAESPAWIVGADSISGTRSRLPTGNWIRVRSLTSTRTGPSYYVAFRQPTGDSFWPDGGGFSTREEAQRDAERRVPTPIQCFIG
jgi:hypothetical protein